MFDRKCYLDNLDTMFLNVICSPRYIYSNYFIEGENKNHKNKMIGVIYRSNTVPKSGFKIFPTYLEILEIPNKENKESVVMRDFNIDLLKFKKYKLTGDFVDNIFSQSFVSVITKSMVVQYTFATLINHKYINNVTKPFHSGYNYN